MCGMKAKIEKKAHRQSLADRVVALVEEARRKVAGAANVALVYTYYEIGRMIVEEEQGGQKRASYGENLLSELSAKLTMRFGKGWSEENLKLMRRFFAVYSNSVNTVYQISATSGGGKKSATALRKSQGEEPSRSLPRFALSWSHYLVLMRESDPLARAFYEREAEQGQWSLRQLSRQMGSQLYERSLKHKGKAGVCGLMCKAPRPEVAEEPLKDPYALEFLGLAERPDYSESQLEQAIIDHLQEFMLELGKGFTFVGRQVRFTFEEEHYKADLVFYNRLTRSFFVFDLKRTKITHQDLGQMQMYVHYYDRVVKLPDENPTIGILLSCEAVNDATVKMTLPECEHNRIFARQYKTVLPAVSSFKRIIREERLAHENRLLLTDSHKESSR